MDAYLDHQAQQVNQARTFAEIRQLEERAHKVARARRQARQGAAWPFGALAARRRPGAVPRGTRGRA